MLNMALTLPARIRKIKSIPNLENNSDVNYQEVKIPKYREMYCLRAGCGKPVPDGRRKYCSDRCGRIVNRDTSAARARRRYTALSTRGGKEVAVRTCLSCDNPFLSEGSWNRICPRCTEKNDDTPPRAEPVSLGLYGPYIVYDDDREY